MFNIWYLHSLASKISDVGQKLCDIHQDKLRRDSYLSLTAKIWVPSLKFMIALPESSDLTTNENKRGMFTGSNLHYSDPNIFII